MQRKKKGGSAEKERGGKEEDCGEGVNKRIEL